MPTIDKQTQLFLDSVPKVEGLYSFKDTHAVIVFCSTLIQHLSAEGNKENFEEIQKLIDSAITKNKANIDSEIEKLDKDIKSMVHSNVNILGTFPILSDTSTLRDLKDGDLVYVLEENRFYRWDGTHWIKHQLASKNTKTINTKIDTSDPDKTIISSELTAVMLDSIARKKDLESLSAKYKAMNDVITTNADAIHNLRNARSQGIIYEAKHGDPSMHIKQAGTSGVFYGPQHKYHVKYPAGSKIMMMNDLEQLITLKVSESEDINKPEYLLRTPGSTETYHAAVLMHESVPKTIPATYIYQVLVYIPGMTSDEAAKQPGYWELAYEKSYVKQQTLDTKANKILDNIEWEKISGYIKGKLQRVLKDETGITKLIDDNVNSEFDVKTLQDTLKGFQDNINKIHDWQNNHNTSPDTGHVPDTHLNAILAGFTQNIKDINTHLTHTAQIIDQMQNNIMRNAANIKLHESAKHIPSDDDKDKPLYEWYMKADAPNTPTETHLNWIADGYNYKYQKDGNWQPIITKSNNDLRIFEQNGKVAYQELVTGLGWLEITAK